MAMDKDAYNVDPKEAYGNPSPPYQDAAGLVETKGIRIGEAADMFGDVETAEEYGYVSRG